ncbi:hypothetical protein BGZ91_010923 [Linnemannia elongata]|nr:hypothetical protein BGZ91_010923 [Linnemannia elongata]
MAYITIDENTLYIQGGMDPSDTDKTSSAVKSKQFFSLDLTRPTTWNTTTTTLPWTQLNADGDSGPAAYGHFMSVTPKRRNITVWDPIGINSSIMSYSLDSRRWTKLGNRPKELTTLPGIQAVADPSSGRVYIPSGRNNVDADMLIYDLLTSTTTWTIMPPREPNNPLQWYGYSFVWSSYRTSFLIFGGGGDVGSYFYEYKVPNNAWTELKLRAFRGYIPPRVKNACLVPAYNGTKMILFGGQTSNNDTLGDLYILDMVSMMWNLTQTVPASQSRHSMACSVSGDNFIIWGGKAKFSVINFRAVAILHDSGMLFLGQSLAGAIMSGTPLIYNINTSTWTTQFVRGTSFTPTGPLTAPDYPIDSEYDTTRSASAEIGGAVAAIVVVMAFGGFLFYRRRKRQRALKNGGQFLKMPASDVSLTHIVSPPPLPEAGTSGKGNIMELNSSRQRLHGSHSNSQPITLAGHGANGNNSNPNNNSSYISHADSINNDLRLSSPPPVSTVPPTNPYWSTPPQNPSWPTSPQPSRPPLHLQATSPSPSSSSSWGATIPPSNSPSAPPPPTSPTAPPPPYATSFASSPVEIFRKEAMTEPTPVPVAPTKKEGMTGSIPVQTLNRNNYNNHINYGESSSSNGDGYAIHERQVEELQHQLAARKEELIRRNSGHRPQYYPPPPPVVSGGSGGFTASKAVARSPQGAGDPVVQGNSSGGSTTTHGTSNEELQQQVQTLQAELNRLQALIGSQ